MSPWQAEYEVPVTGTDTCDLLAEAVTEFRISRWGDHPGLWGTLSPVLSTHKQAEGDDTQEGGAL